MNYQRFNKVLIIDNFDSFTFLIADYFKQFGCDVNILRNNIDPISVKENFDLMVLSPGPSTPQKSNNLLKFIDIFINKKPILGICLGFQAILQYFGSKIEETTPVHGLKDFVFHDMKTIYNGLPSPIEIARYHSFAVSSIKDDFEISGKTNNDIIMSVRHKVLPIEGIQLHPESVLSSKNQIGKRIFSNIVFKHFSNCF